MNKHFTLLSLGLATVLLLGGCRRTIDDPEPTGELLNTRWMLKQVDATPVAVSSYQPDYDSYIQFTADGNQVRGLATCDALQGQFTLVVGSRRLTISRLNVGQSSCAVPYTANRYLAALPQTSRYEISGDSLRLYDAQAARPRLIFQAAR
jgi:hypothetical protein